MAVTRAQVESVLIRRASMAMAEVGMDALTNTGSNADLNDPIASALMALGYTVGNITAVTTADLSQVDSDDMRAFLDTCELRLLETIHNHATTMVDLYVGPRKEWFSQFALSLAKRIQSLSDSLGLSSSVGSESINANFQTHGDDTVIPGGS